MIFDCMFFRSLCKVSFFFFTCIFMLGRKWHIGHRLFITRRWTSRLGSDRGLDRQACFASRLVTCPLIIQWIIVYLKGLILFAIQKENYPNKTIFWSIYIWFRTKFPWLQKFAYVTVKFVKQYCVTLGNLTKQLQKSTINTPHHRSKESLRS